MNVRIHLVIQEYQDVIAQTVQLLVCHCLADFQAQGDVVHSSRINDYHLTFLYSSRNEERHLLIVLSRSCLLLLQLLLESTCASHLLLSLSVSSCIVRQTET